jgi:hypothetical protein
MAMNPGLRKLCIDLMHSPTATEAKDWAAYVRFRMENDNADLDLESRRTLAIALQAYNKANGRTITRAGR